MREAPPSAIKEEVLEEYRLREKEVKRLVTQLEKPTRELLAQMREKLDGGVYQLIVGDDASGRIPVAIFSKIMKSLYKERGFALPETRFFAGSDPDAPNEGLLLEERIKILSKSKEKTQRALLVTDTVGRGRRLGGIMRALEEVGIPFDIATMGSLYLSSREMVAKPGTNFFSGTGGTPQIYSGGKDIAGVKKKTGELFARTHRGSNPEVDRYLRITVIEGRKVAEELSRKLVKWYLGRWRQN